MKNLGLTYCTNVHALGSWSAWHDTIGRFGPEIRDLLAWRTLPMGLWFPSALISEIDLSSATSRERIKTLLDEQRLSTFTFNAFPYGDFHEKVVKTKVYHPDWTRPERLDYTLACMGLLTYLLPPGGEGSISTLPLGWRIGWTEDHFKQSARQLCAWVRAAAESAQREGRIVRLGLEPEPGCALETTAQVIDFWDRHLRPEAKRAGLSEADLENYLGICYDTCHQAVQFEKASEVLNRINRNGIRIVKMQLSSALEFKADPDCVSEKLRREFIEERFLHQVKIQLSDDSRGGPCLIAFDDLPQALDAAAKQKSAGLVDAADDFWAHPWRVHFHVPIDAKAMIDPAWIGTTRDDMLAAYHHAVKHDLCRHFEVETYTWSVLPPAHRPKDDADLARSIANELKFIQEQTPAGVLLNA